MEGGAGIYLSSASEQNSLQLLPIQSDLSLSFALTPCSLPRSDMSLADRAEVDCRFPSHHETSAGQTAPFRRVV